MASPYPTGHNFEKMLSSGNAKPTPAYDLTPAQQQEMAQKLKKLQQMDPQKAALVSQAMKAGRLGEVLVKFGLATPPGGVASGA